MTNNILSMQIEDNSEIFWYNIGRDRKIPTIPFH